MTPHSRLKLFVILALANVLLAACALLSWPPAPKTEVAQSPATCPMPPETFSEEDLVGTWKASYSGGDEDILIIRGDGTYKQIYESFGSIIVETDWQQWWLEWPESGYIRLHLEGMRRCELFHSICRREEGGLDPQEYTTIDMCEGGAVEMPNGVILIVTGANYDTPRGIILRHTRIAGSDWYWGFKFVEE
jgi:hypothetical protein